MNTNDARRKYRRNAWFYDWLIRAPTEALRREAIHRLQLRPGECVVDLGAGTGLSLALLRTAVSETGRVYAVEMSPEMIAIARDKVRDAGWANVQLIEEDAERFELDEPVDAMLCFYTHDIMMSATALPHAMRYLKPGARIVAAGVKLARGWRRVIINPIARASSSPFVTAAHSPEPYALMRSLVTAFTVEERMLGSQYLAVGRLVAP